MSKKLLALNMAILLLVLLPLNFVYAEENISEYNTDASNILVIDGAEYEADSNAEGEGWNYYYHPNRSYSLERPHINAYLIIHENYSGLPVTVPNHVYIALNGNVQGDAFSPAITVHGDAEISFFNQESDSLNSLEVIGFGEQPAIKATEKVYLGGILDKNKECLIQGGNSDTPAILASEISFFDYSFYSGADSDTLNIAHSYADEHTLKLTSDGEEYSISVKKGAVAPQMPQHKNYIFLGWKVNEGQGFVHPNNVLNWYMPGDVVDVESDGTTLQATYIKDNRESVAIVLHGNGGVTEENSKYFITVASTNHLSLYDIPEKSFARDGFRFTGFNTEPDGEGASYSYDYSLDDDGSSVVYNLYAQWESTAPHVKSEVTLNGNTYEVVSKMKNIVGEVFVFAAGYKDNCLVDVKGNAQGLPNILLGDIDEIRVMVWDNATDFKPLCETEIITKDKFHK